MKYSQPNALLGKLVNNAIKHDSNYPYSYRLVKKYYAPDNSVMIRVIRYIIYNKFYRSLF